MFIEAPTAETRERIDALLGTRTIEHLPAAGGYSPAARWRVRTHGGDFVFVKMARSDHTRRALRDEHRVLRDLDVDFAPSLIGFDDDPVHPLLAIEDLGDARWPPPWDPPLIEQVRDTLQRMHAMTTDLPAFEIVHEGEQGGWRAVAEDPEPFLDLDWVSRAWLETALPTLLEADATTQAAGEALTHFDVRSDNLCLAQRGVVLIDWNLACRGNPEMDLGFWLPSLEMEGGPRPERFLPESQSVAAWVSGFFATRAGLPVIEEAPRVRAVQLAQLRTALPWVMRALELAPLDGPGWRPPNPADHPRTDTDSS